MVSNQEISDAHQKQQVNLQDTQCQQILRENQDKLS